MNCVRDGIEDLIRLELAADSRVRGRASKIGALPRTARPLEAVDWAGAVSRVVVIHVEAAESRRPRAGSRPRIHVCFGEIAAALAFTGDVVRIVLHAEVVVPL